jgi:hypothetical protein
MMLRLAQTEVPRAKMSAASSAPALAEAEPPLWAGLGSIITTANDRAQDYSIRACVSPSLARVPLALEALARRRQTARLENSNAAI